MMTDFAVGSQNLSVTALERWNVDALGRLLIDVLLHLPLDPLRAGREVVQYLERQGLIDWKSANEMLKLKIELPLRRMDETGVVRPAFYPDIDVLAITRDIVRGG